MQQLRQSAIYLSSGIINEGRVVRWPSRATRRDALSRIDRDRGLAAVASAAGRRARGGAGERAGRLSPTRSSSWSWRWWWQWGSPGSSRGGSQIEAAALAATSRARPWSSQRAVLAVLVAVAALDRGARARRRLGAAGELGARGVRRGRTGVVRWPRAACYPSVVPRIFHAMLKDGDLPMVGSQLRMLGAAPKDIAPDQAGNVHPGRDGISVAPPCVRYLSTLSRSVCGVSLQMQPGAIPTRSGGMVMAHFWTGPW
jgi:hypothetical protein